jgi:hypothetical protein
MPGGGVRTLRPSRAPEVKGDKRHEDRRCYHAAHGEPADGIHAQLAATAPAHHFKAERDPVAARAYLALLTSMLSAPQRATLGIDL